MKPQAAQIRDRGYQRYQGTLTRERDRWLLIARRMLGVTARQRWVIAMMVLSAFPAVIGGVVMFVQSKVATVAPSEYVPSADPLPLWIAVQPYGTLMLAFLMALLAGGGAIAEDARTGAFQIYFARPITREQYLVGKLAPVALLVAMVAMVPSLLLASLRVALMPTAEAALSKLPLVLAALLLGLVEALTLAALALALSSLSRARSYAQGSFAALFVVPWMMGLIFVRVTRTPWPALLSIPAHLANLGRWLYRLPPEYDDNLRLPVWLSALMLAAIIAGALALLRRRLASVEVVAS